jgi:hypothetical protein
MDYPCLLGLCVGYDNGLADQTDFMQSPMAGREKERNFFSILFGF